MYTIIYIMKYYILIKIIYLPSSKHIIVKLLSKILHQKLNNVIITSHLR